ncbi:MULTISPECIES: peptide chain release factor H [unclassified Serratia (in: enterobacteria)]|uniref:peptide chain release factor H n=1 Tax=unclassified Serratia (in: enterobacteria) TaxID=2647522 RepID=UPI0005070EBA|nr:MULTISPECIES: peptide chain release factor H [unclassified Serratia (in: enterobacteria)]KFK92663.1 peptide chain release factor-like protein [Serratia sp. Ag2]KFL00679.1 peptide chain release factor-like protein [Serratia sp. Ag1]
MILLQISAAHGPDECCLAVSLALRQFYREAHAMQVELHEVERENGRQAGTLRSVLLMLSGTSAEQLAERWCGTLQWICESPWRKGRARKNWFIGAARFSPATIPRESEIRFETLKSSGPGGQHVNKTESAIRATHIASGISVKVQTERSQHANKRLACLLIAHRLEQLEQQQLDEQRAQRWMFHHQIIRGAPVRIFKGNDFTPSQ